MPRALHRECLFLIFGLGILAVAAMSRTQEAQPPHWSYSGREGPAHWGAVDPTFATCSNGHHQSPIDIKDPQKADLPALRFDYNAAPLNIIDNGHTVMVSYAARSTLTVGDKVYTLTQFHFHHPSEERISGKEFAMEAHLVHSDAKGHLAVVAVLFEDGGANSLVETLWQHIPAEKERAVNVSSELINAKDLLPGDLSYYTFVGSLTTPPCNEGVTWYVLKTTSTISPHQLATFAKLYPANNRPIQPTNQRDILESK